MAELRDRFEKGLHTLHATDHTVARVHCQRSPRLPNTSHIALLGTSGHALMQWLDARGVAVSTGSACHSGKPQASHTLLMMGVTEGEALASLRISFGITNTPAEIDRLLDLLAEGLNSGLDAPGIEAAATSMASPD